MKILFTMTPAFNPNAGGVQRTTFKLGKYFTEQGLDVAYFSTANTGHVEVLYGKLYFGQNEGGANNIENINYLAEILKTFQPDFVINQMPYDKHLREILYQNKEKENYILLGCLRNSLFNFKNNARDRMQQMVPKPVFKVLGNSLGVGLVQKRHQIKHAKDLRAIIDQHDKFILLAPPNRDELNYFVGDYKKEKVISIPNSIPNVVENIQDKEKIILHVGRFNIAQKRSDLLLSIWEKAHHYLADWEFVIVGDGEYKEQLALEIKTKKIPRVKLEGFQEPEPYYKKAAIFMMPSAYEGFPNTLIEAQSYGCVPFAFDSYAALSWIVNTDKDAFLSPAFDTEDMAQKIVELASNKTKLKIMQKSALDNAKKFTIEKVGSIWLNLFNKLSSSNE